MRTVVVTAPAAVVSLEEAKAHLRVDFDHEDALIAGMVVAATAHLDGPSGWLGRALGPQTLEARFDRFDCMGLFLPYQPVVSVTSVKYLDPTGVEQTMPALDYEVLGRHLITARSVAWPAALDRMEAVRVRYVAGYVQDPEAGELAPALPAPIRSAILLMVGDLYENRGTAGPQGMSSVPMSTTVENLLSPFRVWG